MPIFLALPAVASLAQEKPVAISARSVTIRGALSEIEAQTGYVIGFRNNDLKASETVTLPRTQGTTREILGYLLAGSGQTWETNGDYIFIVPARWSKPAAVKDQPEPPKPAVVQGSAIPTEVVRFALTPEPEPVPNPRGGYITASRLTETPRLAVKTNLLFDAALTVSIGAEVRLGRKTTFDLPLTHNSWGPLNGRQWENFSVQPGVRLWTCEAFNGFFWGFHAHYAMYNFSNLPSPPFSASMRDNRYQGHLAGAGAHIGYQWILGKRWAMEAELGAGYAYLWYDKFACGECGKPLGSNTRHYFGPTKAALSLVFMIK